MKDLISPPFHQFLDVPKSSFAVLPRNRSPFEILKHFSASSPVLEKKTGANINLVDDLIGRATEQSLINTKPIQHNCLKKVMGPTGNNLNLINPTVKEPVSERNKGKAHLITIMSNYDLSSAVIKDLATLKQLLNSNSATAVPFTVSPAAHPDSGISKRQKV